jgi:hypothetical protein
MFEMMGRSQALPAPGPTSRLTSQARTTQHCRSSARVRLGRGPAAAVGSYALPAGYLGSSCRVPSCKSGPLEGGPPRRSADKTPNPPPAVRTKNLQVASSTRAANARNKHVVQAQVLVTVKRVRNSRLYIW